MVGVMTTTAAPGSAAQRTAPSRASAPRPNGTPRWWADAGGVAAMLSLLVVTALWVSNHGVQQVLGGGPDAISALGRWTGLLASDLLLLQVLLMARVPLVERAFGQDRLARWHRWTGFTSFHLMVAHVVLITIGYAGSAHANVFAELWDMIVSYPGMLLATAGTALLVWSSSRRCGRPGGGCGTSRGTCCTCTPTWGSGWHCRTSCGPARTSSAHRGRGRTGGRCTRSRPARCWSTGSGCRRGATCGTG